MTAPPLPRIAPNIACLRHPPDRSSSLPSARQEVLMGHLRAAQSPEAFAKAFEALKEFIDQLLMHQDNQRAVVLCETLIAKCPSDADLRVLAARGHAGLGHLLDEFHAIQMARALGGPTAGPSHTEAMFVQMRRKMSHEHACAAGSRVANKDASPWSCPPLLGDDV